MVKKSVEKLNKKKQIRISIISVGTALGLLGLYTCFFVPIDSVDVGECPSSSIRLSLIKGEKANMDEAKKKAYELRTEREKANANLPPGVFTYRACTSTDPTYNLYIF